MDIWRGSVFAGIADKQTKFAMSLNALVVPLEALDVAQVQKAKPEAPVALAPGQRQKPIGYQRILVAQLCPVTR